MRTGTYFNNRAKKLGFSAIASKDGNYALYDKDSNWYGRFTPSKDDKPIYYAIDLDKYFDTMKELIEAIGEFNVTRLCPAKCYGDYGYKSLGIEMAFDWYTKTLGYQTSGVWGKSMNSMEMRNVWGEVVSKLYLSIKFDDTKGSICVVKDSSMLSVEFDGVDDMIKAINSLVIPELLLNAANSIKAVNSRIGSVDMSKVKETNLMLEVKNMKEEIKKALTKALEQLN